jgi:hypothetical protein
MRDPHHIVKGESLALTVIGQPDPLRFFPANDKEWFRYSIGDGVISVEFSHYVSDCPDHPDRRDCLTRCNLDVVTEWIRFFPLTSVEEMRITKAKK